MPDNLRVVIDARMADGANGGVQQWVIGLARALSELDGPEEYVFLAAEGHDAWLRPYISGSGRVVIDAAATVAPGLSRAQVAAGRLRGKIAARFPFLRTAYRRLVRRERQAWVSSGHATIQREGAEVMHFPMQAGFRTTVPSIYQPWDLQHLHLPEFFTEDDRRARETAYRAYCAQATRIVVATGWVRDDVAVQYDIPLDKIVVVNPPPVTLAYTPPSAAEEAAVAARLGLPQRYLFYPAQTWGHKNHERLFEALAALRSRGLVIPLVCSGRPTERLSALMDTARRLGVDGQIQSLGFVGTTEVQVLYRRATGLIFPSLYEGWGLPILEAFASGLPVATSNVTSLPALVGEAAIVFDPLKSSAIADAMAMLWTDGAARARLAAAGRVRIRKFDWRHTALRMRALYRLVAARELGTADLELLAEAPLV